MDSVQFGIAVQADGDIGGVKITNSGLDLCL